MNVEVERMLLALGIQFQRRGTKLFGHCPLPGHVDRKPSWDIRDQPGHERHGLHHCFSCQRGGNPVTLVSDVLDIDRESAFEWLRDNGLLGGDAPLANGVEIRIEQEALRSNFRLPEGTFFKPLDQWVTPARRYAVSRGITAEQVQRWNLGFSVDGRLGCRIVIPIRDERGVLVSYTARAFDGDETRYMDPHSHENPSRHAIFGAERWGSERKRVCFTEGELNALACERAGAPCIAAIGGSNVTPSALAALASFEEIIDLSDPDAAGDNVSMKIACLARWRKLRKVQLPRGQDANDLPEEELRRLIAGCIGQ